MSISMIEIGWAAGFLEGEGCFGNKFPDVSATQVQREPLERLVKLFGGKIYPHGSRRTAEWHVSRRRSVQIVMTLYPLMSPKRQKTIETTIRHWRSYTSKIPKDSKTCPKGHEFTEANTYRFGPRKTFRDCRKCHAEYEFARRRRAMAGIAT